jgi:uncharacterized protein YbjT (DUF2867 family)
MSSSKIGKILVLGASGNIGKPLVDKLAKSGLAVRAASRHSQALPSGVEAVRFDYADASTHAPAFEGVERLFLLTPASPDMAELTQRLLESARRAGVKRVVRISAQGADSARMLLGRWHADAEQKVRESGLDFVTLRPTGFMQNFTQAPAKSIRATGKFFAPLGDARVAYIDVRDIAEAAAQALTGDGHEGQSYELTGPAALTNFEVAEIFTRVLERPVTYVPVPEAAARDAMSGSGMPPFLVDAVLDLYRAYREGMADHPSDAVLKLTGRAPRDFARFAVDHRQAFL